MKLSSFLVERLENIGIKHVFGVPGDYVLPFYKELENSNIEVICNTDEVHSGFAADAYARVNGVGCVVVTYSVGASKVINAVQCAYAERSPLIVISGAPGISERNSEYLLHHMVNTFNSQEEMFKHITVHSAVLDNPNTAGYEVDYALEKLKHYKRPVYLEIPRDVAKLSISYDVYEQGTPDAPSTDVENLREVLEEVSSWIDRSSRPVILAGVELARYGLGENLIRFAEKNNIPVATTLLSKSVIDETHPLFIGVYSGSSSHELVRDAVENSDCLLLLGVMLTDLTLCFMPAKFNKRHVVCATMDELRVKNHYYHDVQFYDFCVNLFDMEFVKKEFCYEKYSGMNNNFPSRFSSNSDAPITSSLFFGFVNSILDKNMAILADVGDSMFGAADLVVKDKNHFLSPAFYTSMGFAVPGCLGVQLANRNVRPIAILGDGSFQMSVSEISLIAHLGLNPIICVLNNHGYTTERLLMEGKFNDIPEWNYHKVGELFEDRVEGYLVRTEGELVHAFTKALSTNCPVVINILLNPDDYSPGLQRLCCALSKCV